MRIRGEFSALPGLILEEIGCFEHCDPPQQKPRSPGLRRTKNAEPGYLFQQVQTILRPPRWPHIFAGSKRRNVTGDCTGENIQSTRETPRSRGVYLQLTIQAYGSAYGRRRSASALPVLRLGDAVASYTFQGQSEFGFPQLRLQLVRRRPQRFAARGNFGNRLASTCAGLSVNQDAVSAGTDMPRDEILPCESQHWSPPLLRRAPLTMTTTRGFTTVAYLSRAQILRRENSENK